MTWIMLIGGVVVVALGAVFFVVFWVLGSNKDD